MLVLLLAGCEQRPVGAVAADASRSEREAARVGRGAALIEAVGCGSCHRVPGIRGAVGDVGPPLMYVARRTFIAGQVPNTTENLVRWLKDPPALVPGTAMPALGLSDSQARDIAAYLQTLR
jgi:cytochrome c1